MFVVTSLENEELLWSRLCFPFFLGKLELGFCVNVSPLSHVPPRRPISPPGSERSGCQGFRHLPRYHRLDQALGLEEVRAMVRHWDTMTRKLGLWGVGLGVTESGPLPLLSTLLSFECVCPSDSPV